MLFATLLLMCPFPQAGDTPKTVSDAPVLVASADTKDSATSQPLPAAPVAKVATDAAPGGEVILPSQHIIPRNTPLPAAPAKAAFFKPYENPRQRKMWYGLAISGHSAAVFDAWSTRRAISGGFGTESNPMLRPFASSGALYAATQVSPAVMDYLGRRMMMSQHNWVRKIWWLPQATGAGFSISAGVHNTRLVP
jgi:hypothetical protein